MYRRTCWHVSSSENRASIAAYGVDWRRMGKTGGIAAGTRTGGPYTPELDAVFLCEALDDVEFFVGFGQQPLVDVWTVVVSGIPIEPGPDGWLMCRTPIPPARVHLLHADRTPQMRELYSVWLAFVATRVSVDEMSALADIVPDDAGEGDGDELGREPGRRYAWWVLEGDDRYSALPGQADGLLGRIARAEAGLVRLAAVCDEVSFGARARSGTWRLDPESAALLERLRAAVEISVGGT